MVITILIIVVFIAASVTALYFWQRAPRADKALPPPPEFRGLFDDQSSENAQGVSAKEDARRRVRETLRARLLERAALQDLGSLDEAHSAVDRNLYNEVLDELVQRAETSHDSLRALVTHITESKKLRSNARLARVLIEGLKRPSDRRQMADALHVAALSDDAAIYEQAVEKAVESWQVGQAAQVKHAAQVKAEELLALIESQYWLLSPESRRAGAGFSLRQTLERCRRQMANRARAQ